MSTTNLQDNLNWLLIRSTMLAKQRLMRLAEEYDLTLMQAFTLCLLEPGQAVPMSKMSDWLVCDASNVTGIVERLSVGSYIDRRESSIDRRVKTIQLTESGLALRNKMLPRLTETAPNFVGLSQSETDDLKKILLKIQPVPTAKA